VEYLVFIGAIIAVFIILKILAWPIKKIFKMVINIVVGGILLVIVNYIGGNFGFVIPINWITALVVGALGIPGLIVLVILTLLNVI